MIPQAYAPGAIVSVDPPAPQTTDSEVDPRAATVALGADAVLPSDLHFPPITRIAHYDILGEIARGGMGVVYRARDTKLNRLVAVKVLLEGQHASQENVERFLREAQNTARLRHPNIVPIFDLGVHDGKNYLVMEYIVGQPLSHLVHSKDLTTERAVDLMVQAVEAVEHAHREGIVHRDLKPANILVDTEWRGKVTDFGLAKAKKGASDLTKSGTAMGTPYYMPPEQARGDMRQVDVRSDIYSLGAVLYECLSGKPPLVGENDIDTIIKVVNEEPAPPSTVRSSVPADLDHVCLKCLEKDPERRYQSARELLDELNRYRTGEGVLARGTGPLSRLMRRARRHRSLLVSGAMGFAAAVTLFGMLRLGRDPRRQREPVVPGPAPVVQRTEIPFWQSREVAWAGEGWEFGVANGEEAWTAGRADEPLVAGVAHEGIARLSFSILADREQRPDLEVRMLANPLNADDGYTVTFASAWNTLEVRAWRGSSSATAQVARVSVTQRWIPVRVERTVDGLWVWTGGSLPSIRLFDPAPGFRRESRQIALASRTAGARVGALRLETASDSYLRHAVGTGDRMFDRQAWDIAAEQYRFALSGDPGTDIEWEAVYKLALCDLKEGERTEDPAAFDRAAEGFASVLRHAAGRPAARGAELAFPVALARVDRAGRFEDLVAPQVLTSRAPTPPDSYATQKAGADSIFPMLNLARTARTLKETAEKVEELRRRIAACQTRGDTHCALAASSVAELFHRSGQSAEAERAAEEALLMLAPLFARPKEPRPDPDAPGAEARPAAPNLSLLRGLRRRMREILARSLVALARPLDALSAIDGWTAEAAGDVEESAQLMLLKGDILRQSAATTEAIEAFRAVEKLDNPMYSIPAHRMRIYTLAATGDLTAAFARLEAALQRWPRYGEIFTFDRGVLLLASGKTAEARSAFEAAAAEEAGEPGIVLPAKFVTGAATRRELEAAQAALQLGAPHIEWYAGLAAELAGSAKDASTHYRHAMELSVARESPYFMARWRSTSLKEKAR